MVVLETQRLEKKVRGHRRKIIMVNCAAYNLCNFFIYKALFISVGPYELGGVAMSHKKAGNEETARRLRTNLKDVHWYVAFVLFQTCF